VFFALILKAVTNYFDFRLLTSFPQGFNKSISDCKSLRFHPDDVTQGASIMGDTPILGDAMRRRFMLMLLFAAASVAVTAQSPARPDWRAALEDELPLLGHRNWILIVDSAYPLQASPGIETVETDAPEIEVLRQVLGSLDRTVHLRPEVFLDSELSFVAEEDASGVSAYRRELHGILENYTVQSLPHEQLIGRADEAGKTMHVLVLKTRMAVPYSSVFIRLNCKYWGDDAEKRMRARMAKGEAADR
jgi:hypothetical protein